ncbi:MAG: type II toxin-antitoxin system MqsA family antitoxin [Pseudomonadota bacterium]|nr:type II toxin-antitoxin system MqsA family antitoxin [Pseudomonadota bacterium]
MAKKWNGQPCPVCHKGTLRDGVKRLCLEYRGRIYESEQSGAWCDHCDEGIMTGTESSEDETKWMEFRDRIDREEIAELVRIRKKLKMTQQQAARLAGGGKNAFSRYERGQAKPVSAVINLFRLLDKHPDLVKELE